MKTATEKQVGNAVVEIKSRREDNASGWSIISFTPTGSLRTTRPHIESVLDKFVDAIIASVDRDLLQDDSLVAEVKEAVLSIID
tara:strand:+ start:123 stop:374 length:252 start_codon:yes stop_codon:yes gene_type:complete